jgi:hypothetical protein
LDSPAHHQHRGVAIRCSAIAPDASRRFKKTENAEAMIWKLPRVALESGANFVKLCCTVYTFYRSSPVRPFGHAATPAAPVF